MIDAAQTALKDPSILNAAVFCVAAVGGQVLHAVKKWSDGYDWVFSNPRATVGALIANFTGMAAFVALGNLESIQSMAALIGFGISWGLGTDSVVNRGSQRAWTDEERAANAAKARK